MPTTRKKPTPHWRYPRRWWIISVTGYGSFAFYGSEVEVDHRARAKAQWEGGCGTYRQAKRKTSKEDAAMVASEKER